jgi:hypothetical protein
MTESCGYVIGIRRFGKIGRVTGVTVSVHKLIIAIDMTRLARRGCLRTGQAKLGRAVIEG